MSSRDLVRRLVPRAWRNWLRSPVQSARWLADEMAHGLGRDRTAQLRPTWMIRCHPAALRTAFLPALVDHEQAVELDRFIAACRPGMRLLDVGAHFGLFSLAALHYGGPEATAVAVDPSPVAARMLRLHAAMNQLTDRLSVVEAAVTARSGTLDLVPVGVIGAGYYVRPQSVHGHSEIASARAFTLDDLVSRQGAPPTHIKIDVEGFEADVLRGATRTLANAPRPMLFVELHNRMVRERGDDPGETLRLLAAAGYRVEGSPDGPLVRIVARALS